ncbi:MAG: alternate-type signal peptide domain-containing protein [Salinibacterium sp.]|nr:alternate-type signal peptide domain-containing protein [Salinibacterium sp.]MBF0671101.1 alternate-type signal peptide domain-containing protein [Salinibacterium sp.]
MNKLLKGSIAGAAGIALLLGGAGTLALWNDSETITGGTITAGELELTVVGSGVWTDQNDDVIDLDDYRIVPGDELTYTASFDVSAVGDNLSATVDIAEGSIAAATPNDAEDEALASFLTDSATIAIDGGAAVAAGSPIAVSDGETVTVAVTISFSNGIAGTENGAMNGAVNLGDFAVELTQVV